MVLMALLRSLLRSLQCSPLRSLLRSLPPVLLLVLLACGAAASSDEPALASDLELSAFEGRVDACASPLVAHNDTCTCDAGWTWEGQACAPCGAGSFKAEPGLHACSSCPPLTTSFEGAAEAEDCLCVAGHQNASGACEACAAGAYKPFVGNNSCVACPANSVTLGAGADSLELCLCLPGYVASAAGEEACAACPRNTYTVQTGDPACASCPADSGTDGPGSTFAACRCEAGFAPGGANETLSTTFCVACAAGKYKSARSMDACTSCPEHMSSAPGATALANCSCNAGFEKAAPGACDACAADAYCPGADAKLACPGNSTSPAGTAALAGCTCVPGFFWYDSRCVECSENHFCASNARSPCPPNSSSAVGSVSIDNCTCVPGFRGA